MIHLHIIGAGLAGLAAAVEAASRGFKVALYESSTVAGGRARSFYDEVLECRIDNGNHLILSGNSSVQHYLDLTGAKHTLCPQTQASFPFVDLTTGERWTVKPGKGRIPFWLFQKGRGVPGATLRDVWDVINVCFFSGDKSLRECVSSQRPFHKRFWEPLTLAALNTPVEQASASLLGAMLRESFLLGEAASRPMVVERGLSESFVDPALDYICTHGGQVSFKKRLTGLECQEERVCALRFGEDSVAISDNAAVILALPPWQMKHIIPSTPVPERFHAIVNVHFKVQAPHDHINTPFIGILNGISQWIFIKQNTVSITISAADKLVDDSSESIAAKVWPEIVKVLDVGEAIPPVRVIKEKRATFSQIPQALKLRAKNESSFSNLFIAGDWTDTQIPATLEGAIRSGFKSAVKAAARF